MKAAIVAGGLGTRISDEAHLRPKPLTEISNKRILWRILKINDDFVLCCGHKGYLIN